MPRVNVKPAKRDTTKADLAIELGFDEQTITRHVRRGAPHSRRDRRLWFNVAEYRAWMDQEGLSGERGRPLDGGNSPDIEAARLRKENALAAKYELQVARERGELVDKAEYRGHWMREVTLIKGKCRGLGASIAPSLVGMDAAEIQRRIDERVEQIFRELSE